jgi:hypothetical protein
MLIILGFFKGFTLEARCQFGEAERTHIDCRAFIEIKPIFIIKS